ncbi:MAG TPA: hypothetical protein P5307_15490, partial [Pirellulaceae bacterium]|nr:hypothetical protein [Pirellulaceae bacterium]
MSQRIVSVALTVLLGFVLVGCTPQKPVANAPASAEAETNTTSADVAVDASPSVETSEPETM